MTKKANPILAQVMSAQQKVEKQLRLCSICGNGLAANSKWHLGNNAAPLNNGRCCDPCNRLAVLPARILCIKMWEAGKASVEQTTDTNTLRDV